MAKVSQSTLFPPPVRGSTLSDPERKYLFTLQNLLPLVEVDTSSGPVALALPQAGLTSAQTGQSNQNQEIIYIKISPDANTVTITGAKNGTQILAAQFNVVRFKSDGTNWYVAASGLPNFADNETPSGPINGVNVTFVWARTPNPPASLQLFLSGIKQTAGGDFVLAGNVMTMTNPPVIGSILNGSYRY
jgi:hypothetical protein